MTRKTLGELMTAGGNPGKSDESESQVAAYAFAPAPQESGLGVPFVPKDGFSFVHLIAYGSSQLESNKMQPETTSFSPGLETGILSQEGTQVYTNSDRFTDDGPDDPILHFNRTSSGFFRKKSGDEAIAVGNFKKNTLAGGETDVSGHDLLANEGHTLKGNKASDRTDYRDDPQYADVDPTSRPIAYALHQTLDEFNRFTPSSQSPYLDYNKPGEAAFVKGLYSFQREMGVFNKDAPAISINNLRKIGGELLFKAQSVSTGDAETLMKNRSSGGFGFTLDLMALIPHMTQIGGGKVNSNRLRVRVDNFDDAFSDIGLTAQDDLLAVQGFETILGLGGDDPHVGGNLSEALSASSFGTMNSPGENFSGVLSAGMAMPVLFGMLGVGLFGEFVLPLIVGGFKKDTEQSVNEPESPWTYTLGRNVSEERSFGNDMLELMGFPRGMSTGIFEAISAGLMLFYGLKEPIGPFTLFDASFLEEAVNLFFSPGYYLVITKGVLRDIGTITNAVAGLFSDFNGVFATIASVFSMIETIFTSYTFKFLVVMAQTGAQALRGYQNPGMHGHLGGAITYKKERTERLTALNRTKLSRVYDSYNGRQLAESPLSLSRHNALFLLTDGNRSLSLGEFDKEKNQTLGSYVAQTYRKISPEDLAAMEERIEAEYVPFSLQDMRTNEIMSLPAFISSVTDDFAVQHAASHGYGRTDPVYTYSKTTRSINLVFNLVAMNEEDHHFLYHIINKIVAMCYPQRDRGLIRKQGTGPSAQIFAQPFSQSPTASPLVRIRLGDLLKTNKSVVAMQNIFGGSSTLSLKGDTKPDDILQNARDLAEFEFTNAGKIQNRRQELWQQVYNGDAPSGQPVVVKKGTQMTVKAPGGKTHPFKTQVDFYTTILGVEKEQGSNDSPVFSKGGSSTHHKIKIDLKEVLEDPNGPYAYGGWSLAMIAAAYENAPISFPPAGELKFGTIKPEKSSMKFLDIDLVDGAPPEPPGKTAEELTAFLSEETNPVVRSFTQGAPGTGLAGVITQLGISYDGALWGTTHDAADGLVGPMKAQITMGFAPIHDMPLGLTADGHVIAPSHPMGSFSDKNMGVAGLLSDATEQATTSGAEKIKILAGFKKHLANSSKVTINNPTPEKIKPI